jgi:hypothetical protein
MEGSRQRFAKVFGTCNTMPCKEPEKPFATHPEPITEPPIVRSQNKVVDLGRANKASEAMKKIRQDPMLFDVLWAIGSPDSVSNRVAFDFLLDCRMLEIFGLNTFVSAGKLPKTIQDKRNALEVLKESGFADRWLKVCEKQEHESLALELSLFHAARELNTLKPNADYKEKINAFDVLYRNTKRSDKEIIQHVYKYAEHTKGEQFVLTQIIEMQISRNG